MTRSAGSPRWLAWALGLTGAVACVLAGGVVWLLNAPASFLLVDLVGVLLALLGATIASRHPANPIGWLMILTSLCAALVHLPAGYASAAFVGGAGPLPLANAIAWFSAWSWVPVLAFLPLMAVRFPDGGLSAHWRPVEWLSIVGTGTFALGIALEPPAVLVGFMPVPGSIATSLGPHLASPIGIAVDAGLLALLQGVGLTLVFLGFVGAAASVLARFRTASGDERLQLKWFAFAGAVVALTFLFGAAAWNFFGLPLYVAFTPLEVATLTVPVAIAIAILRYRLYDIDLLINRSLVYVSLTAILTALYTAVITLLQRVFISVSGQRSDAAAVLTAFVVVVAFSPVKDWLQRQVDRRLPRTSSASVLAAFRADVETALLAMDAHRLAARLLDEAVLAFDAQGAALFIDSSPGPEPLYRRGEAVGDGGVTVELSDGSHHLGRLVLGTRRGGLEYADRDRAALVATSDLVAQALALSNRRAPSTDSVVVPDVIGAASGPDRP